MNVDPNKKKIIEEYSVHNNVTKIIIIVMIVKEKKEWAKQWKRTWKIMAFFLAMIPDHTIYCIKSEIQKHTHTETHLFYVIRLFKKLTLPKKNFISYFLVPEKHWRKIQQDYNDINYSSLSIFQTNVSFCPILNRILFYFENNHITHINKNGKGHPIWPKKIKKKFSLLPGTKKMHENNWSKKKEGNSIH